MVLGLDLEALLTVIAGASIGTTFVSTWRNRHTVEDMKALLIEMRAKDIEKIKVAVSPPGGVLLPASVRRSPTRTAAPLPRRIPPVAGPPPRVPRPVARPPEEPMEPPPAPEPPAPRPVAPPRRIIQEEEITRRRRIEESGGEDAPPAPEPPVREVVDLEPEPPATATGSDEVVLLEPPAPRKESPKAPPPPAPKSPAPLPARASPALMRKRGESQASPLPAVHVPQDANTRQRLLASRKGLGEALEEQVKKGLISRRTYDYLAARAPPREAPPARDAKRVEALLAALDAQRQAGALSEETYRRSRAQLLKQLGQ